MRAYSVDLRQRVVAAVDGGMSQARAATVYAVSIGSVERWIARRAATGSLAPAAQRHAPVPVKADALAAWLPARLDAAGDAHDATLAEHAAAAHRELDLVVSPATISRAISALPPPPDAALTATGRSRRPGRPLKQRPSAPPSATR